MTPALTSAVATRIKKEKMRKEEEGRRLWSCGVNSKARRRGVELTQCIDLYEGEIEIVFDKLDSIGFPLSIGMQSLGVRNCT